MNTSKHTFALHTRFEGAIIRDHHILLIKERINATGRSFWMLPGGGIEPSETDEDCVKREMKEETNLDVKVKRLLSIEPAPPNRPYPQIRTYLCVPLNNDAKPGFGEGSTIEIIEVKWFDLRSEADWDPLLVNDPFTYDQLQRVRKELGYLS